MPDSVEHPAGLPPSHPLAQQTLVVAPTPNPVRPDDTIDFDKMARNIERWLATELSGFVVGSYGGEEFHIGEPDKLEAVRVVSEVHAGKRFVIAGIDSPSPTEAVRLAHRYAEAGADMVRVRIPAMPSSARGTSGNVAYFERVTRDSPVPVVVIHQPSAPGMVATTPEELAEITSLDNIFAYIISLNFRWEARAAATIADNVNLWTCNGSLLYPGAAIGAVGACLFFGNWAPAKCRQIIRLTMAGRHAEAVAIQQSLIHADYLGMSYGVAALKAGLNLLGFEATVPRRPTLPLPDHAVQELRQAFAEAGILPHNP